MKKGILGIVFVLVFFMLGVFSRPYLFGDSRSAEEISTLQSENMRLRKQIFNQQNAAQVITDGEYTYISAELFSTYPLNHKKLLVLNVGTSDGVEEGMPVVIGGDTVLGRVNEVWKHNAAVRTIFDPGWSIPVRIGSNGYNGLLLSGGNPQISMIDRESEIENFDEIYSTSELFPYGLTVGEISDVSVDNTNTLKTASVDVDYSVGSLSRVQIISDFNSR